MRFIIFQSISSNATPEGYNNLIKIAYLLNERVITAGIDSQFYFLIESFSQATFENMLDFLKKDISQPKEFIESIYEAEISIKEHKKLKNKSSKSIIAYNLLKKTLNKRFIDNISSTYETLEKVYGLENLKKILEKDVFYFFPPNWTSPDDLQIGHLSITDILSLNLPNNEEGIPLFFINTNTNDDSLIDFEILDAHNPLAKDKKNAYGVASFSFPRLNDFTNNDLFACRNQLTDSTIEFREKLNKWASICYENPNTNKGLDYFKKNMNAYLISQEKELYKNQIINNASFDVDASLSYQLLFAEIPIVKVWEIHKKSKDITEEQYNQLMASKLELSPKYDGRWPVVLLKQSAVLKNMEKVVDENNLIQSVRKTISID